MRRAIDSLRCRVRAIALTLSSSIVPATTAAPYFFASRQTWASFSSPSSRFIELSTHRPPTSFSPASITSGFVLSSISGAGIALT